MKAAWNEDRVHRWMRAHLDAGALAAGFGNDAAVLRGALAGPVLCCDQTVEGVHYERGVAPRRIGNKAASRALSDLAASASQPRALLLALSLPPETPEAWIRALVRAVAARGQAFGALLAGGDLCCARAPATISVTALGERPRGRSLPSRARARAGHVVVITGATGGSSLGRHLDFEPKVRAGRWLWEHGARAMMDTSDGLARDLARMAHASGVRIELEDVPVHADARRLAKRDAGDALEHALFDGEDYELIATLPRARLPELLARAPRVCPQLALLGRVKRGSGVYVRASGNAQELRKLDPQRGWCHGT